MVTEIEHFPSGEKAFRVWWGVGDLKELLAMRAGLESVARVQGCSYVLIEGRKGWEGSLKNDGFEFYSTVLRKKL